MISIDGLAVEFGGTTLFSDISFVINEKDRIALMGKNGAGKSTLLKILAGVRQPTRGKNLSAQRLCYRLPAPAPDDRRRTYRLSGNGTGLCPPARNGSRNRPHEQRTWKPAPTMKVTATWNSSNRCPP